MLKRILLIIPVCVFSIINIRAGVLPSDYGKDLGNAYVRVADDMITVGTGKMERQWTWNGNGLVTTSLKDLAAGKEWAVTDTGVTCDWDLPKAITPSSKAEFVSFSVGESDDDGFTSPHLEVITHIRYGTARLEIQHVVWVYPDAPGIRTQLRVKAMDGFVPDGLPGGETKIEYYGHPKSVPSARAEYLPLDFSVRNRRLYWGYYNDPGSRHDQSRDMLKEELITGYPVFQDEDIDWASGIAAEYDGHGVMAVKESHKCANQQGHYTGSFYAGPQGLKVTGWGLKPEEITTDRFRECWANWTIVYSHGNDGMQLALKQFDRARFPVFPERDMMIINDTWGPADPGGHQFAKEEHVLKEIPLLADLGVDVIRIDDGWQIHPWGGDKEIFLPSYPDGWKNVKQACEKNGVKLGLWVAIQRAKQEDLLHNLKEAGVVTWKIDFDHLNDRGAFENRFAKIREVMKASWMRTQFSFCPEYNHPRYGWYYAKEYGSIYFQNIQEALPEHLIMVPYHVLRQNWLMSKYLNGNKIQTLLQNPKRVDGRYSDAPLHSHGYCFAMGIPFVPVFFQSAQFLDGEGRAELKDLIALYKEHRAGIFESYSFPVGETPSNEGWSGFQFVNDGMDKGYLLLFREIHNKEVKKDIRLKFLAGKTIETKDLKTGVVRKIKISSDGTADFTITDPADFAFLSYTVK